jgi:hypothetical protein
MADFNMSLSGPSAAGAQPIAAIQPPTQLNTAAPWINLGASLVEVLGKNMEEQKKADKLQQQNAIISEYTAGMSTLAQTAETGQLSPSEISARKQAFHRKMVATYPVFSDEFGKINKNLTEFSALSNVETEQKAFDDARKKTISDMQAAGYPINDKTPKNVLEANIEAYQTSLRTEGEFKKMKERVQFNMSLSAEQRTQQEFDQKQQANKLLAEMGDTHLSATMQNVQNLISEFDKTGDAQGSSMKLYAMFQNIDSTIAALSSSNPTAAKAYKDLFDGVRKLGEEGIKPGKNAEMWNQKLQLLQNQVKFQALSSSPEAKTLYGASALFHGNMPATFLDMNVNGRDAYAALGLTFGVNKPVPQVVGTDNLQGTLDGAKSQIAKTKTGGVGDVNKVLEQSGNVVNNVLKQLGNASGIGLDAKKVAPAVSFLGTSEFLELQKAGRIDNEALTGAKNAIQVLYQREVVKGVESKLGTSGGNLEFNFNGAGVVLQPAASGKPLTYLEQGARNNAIKEFENTSVVINQIIRAGAHMEGHDDYRKYWEENKHFIVPSYFPDPVKLKVGQVESGYKYLGGNVKDKNNWQKVGE